MLVGTPLVTFAEAQTACAKYQSCVTSVKSYDELEALVSM